MNAELWDTLRFVLEGFGVVIMTALGFVVKSLRDADAELAVQIKSQSEEISTLRETLSEKYVQKDDFREALREVKGSIDGIRELLITHFKQRGE